MPEMPLTIEGSAVLHQMLRMRWAAWKLLTAERRMQILEQAAPLLQAGGSAVFSLIGHKGDLMTVHFRKDFVELNRVEVQIAKLDLWDYVEQTTSYVSVVELGLYDSTSSVYAGLIHRGIAPHSEAWNREIEEVLARQRAAMAPRLCPEIPNTRYICFYPMDRKRGESKNWYQVPMNERMRMMKEHGMIGRRYAGLVKQIITGSIGFDDWEWGVDLFADDALVFKKLIYEMRFDEVSAVYALFGTFYLGLKMGGLVSDPFFA